MNKEKQDDKQAKAARINVQLGAAYLERKDLVRAKQKFLLATKEAPELPEVWYSLAYFFETTGNQEQAKQYYMKALALAPSRGDVLNNYATYLCRKGNFQVAIQHFLKAVQDAEYLDASSAYENAGLCAEKIPDRKLAIQYFNKALLEDPARPVSLIELAELHYQEGNHQLANAELNQFLQISSPMRFVRQINERSCGN